MLRRLRSGSGSPSKAKSRDNVLRSPSNRSASDGTANGFSTTSEKAVLDIESCNIAPFSLPQEVLSFNPTDEDTVQTFKGGKTERKLHCNIRLTASEMEKLELLQMEARTQGSVFYPSITSSATRYLDRAGGDHRKALSMMEATQEWRTSFFEVPLRDASLMDDLRLGIVYFCGRDTSLRPTMVFRASRIPTAWQKAKDFDRVIRIALFCVEYFLRYMTVPGRVECFNVLVDLKDIGATQIPVAGLKELNQKLGGHYVGRGAKFFVCNMSRWLSPLVSMLKGVLSERRSQKLVFINHVQELHSHFALHQLEEDLGGSMPSVDTFFPFPLQPGPFTAGFDGGPRLDAVAGAHEVLSLAGVRGRLWDPSRSDLENTKLEYTEKAATILKACGLPVPPDCISVGFEMKNGMESPSTCTGDIVESRGAGIGSGMVFNGQVLLEVIDEPLPPHGEGKIIILL